MLATPVNQLAGIGQAGEANLHKAGIRTLWDLLLHLPIRYEDRTQLTPDHACVAGCFVQREGIVSRSQVMPARKPVHRLTLQTGNLDIHLVFLNYDKWAHTLPNVGQKVRIYGQLKADFHGNLEMLHPSMTRLSDGRPAPLPKYLTAIYPVIGNLKQVRLSSIIHEALSRLSANVASLAELPNTVTQGMRLVDALHQIHHASVGTDQTLLAGTHPAIQRLALEELTAHQLVAQESRAKQAQYQAVAFSPPADQSAQLLATLGFSLTQGQQQVLQQIRDDLQQNQPMHRLLQGDVGSGKTVIAALAAMQAAENRLQTAIMAPTEILAEQLHATLTQWFSPLGVSCRLLTGSSKAGDKRQTLLGLADGSLSVVVGTHALFQEEVNYAQLGLVVVDEQHRFGVEQRLALKHKGQQTGQEAYMPHLLHMTATPIPRSLAMTVYGDLNITSLMERPPGRQAIDTLVIPESKREQLAERLVQACRKGAQAYWVCPFIEPSEAMDAQNVTETAYWFKTRYPDVRIGLVHGQMSSKDKEAQMHAFKAGMLHLLIATTVIEVGVNVPNATLMVIDNAERFGLAQLHQLRGRVGRGAGKSHCTLIYRPPLSATAQERLASLKAHQDGFILAEQDLRLRGPGEVLGKRQTGLTQWHVADLIRDSHLHQPARELAAHILQHQPTLAQTLIHRWLADKLSFAGG